VNGLGATPQMELDIVLRAAHDNLARRGMTIERAWAGTLLSALNMPGCSISLMRVDAAALDLLDAPTEARAWPGGGAVNRDIRIEAPAGPASPAIGEGEHKQQWIDAIQPALKAVADTLIANEPKLTELDSLAGDGDLGASMKRAAQAILDVPAASLGSPYGALAALSAALRRAIAGSSGPFYATALMRASRHLEGNDGPQARDWAVAFREAVQAISDLGGAKAGDRTMLDALIPAADAFTASLDANASAHDAWEAAVAAAQKGADDTASMTPRAGRASYLGERAKGVADGGAVAVTLWLQALAPHVGGGHKR
jgi:triose/dihydroxyacetone kinase / FAD-AMP lyase (cyclizing)